jgi:hypothetical protein
LGDQETPTEIVERMTRTFGFTNGRSAGAGRNMNSCSPYLINAIFDQRRQQTQTASSWKIAAGQCRGGNGVALGA